MTDLHNILGNMIDVAADMENLRIMLKITEQSAEVGEEELRAGVNIAILSLAALKKKIDKEVNALDGFLLEQWQKEPTTMPV